MLSSRRLLYKSGSRPAFFLAGLILLFAACGAGPVASEVDAANKQGAEERAVKLLFPVAGEVEDWTPEGDFLVFRGDGLYDHIDGGADIYYEYGFTTLVVRQYKSGSKEVSIEIYCMDDAPAAFGIYSYNRHPTLSTAAVGDDGAIHPNGLFFWQDRYYVDIRQLGSERILGEEFLALAKTVEKKIGSKAGRPAVMDLLPAENKVDRSDVFARGKLALGNQVYVAADDLFGLEKGETAAVARYSLGKPEFSVIVVQYASEYACAAAFARLRSHFLGDESAREVEFVTTPMPGKYHGVHEAGSRLIVVANADTEANALKMLRLASGFMGAE